jgi:hypothetical protein
MTSRVNSAAKLAAANGRVEPSETVTDAVRVSVQDCQQIRRRGLDEQLFAHRIVRPALESPSTSGVGGRNSVRRHFVHHGLSHLSKNLPLCRDTIGI